MPLEATLPSHQGCSAAHSMTSWKSSTSRVPYRSRRPGDFPVPRVSTRTRAYPRGTHHSGFGVSQTMCSLLSTSS